MLPVFSHVIGVIVARFVFGPMDGEFLPIPQPEPMPIFVVPFITELMITPLYYVLAGQEDYTIWNYLYDELFEIGEYVSP